MKKRFFRLSKRILILMLCTTLISGSVVNKYKITANATTVAASLGAYSLYELCLYIGGTLLASCGLATLIDNFDEIASLGKDFVDSIDLTNESGWMFTKVTTTGQSYVFGTEALQEIQDTSFSVIQGGGNRPDDDDDNNNDDEQGDGEHMVDVLGLSELAVFGTVAFYDLFERYAEPLIEGMRNGEESFITKALGIQSDLFTEDEYEMFEDLVPYQDLFFDGNLEPDAEGNYSYKCYYYYEMRGYGHRVFFDLTSSEPLAGYYELGHGIRFNKSMHYLYYNKPLTSGNWDLKQDTYSIYFDDCNFPAIYRCNFPIFASQVDMNEYLETGNLDKCINNAVKVYTIADWLQEDWTSPLTQLNTGIRSLNDNMLIVGEAMNQALQNQMNGLGYISAIGEGIAGVLPLALPDSIADPIYYPADSSVPKLAPEELPWNDPVANPDSPEDEPPYDPDISEVEVWEVIHGTDTFGLNTLFGILILLIMILIMLLFIFLSCLAFIIMIFRIPAQTGFLPEEMIAALDYLKTLQIPGFGMSVYGFFMALIYILLIFTVIGILRKNIDKIKFPRKGRR